MVIDCAGYGTTTASAIQTVRPSGRVVQVGLRVTEGVIPLLELVVSQAELVGSVVGDNNDCAAVLRLMAEGKLTARTTQISFNDISDGMERLERGEVVGRLVAVF